MSVFVKTMTNLPEYCHDCPCHNMESGYCQADKEHRYSVYRPFWCPLVKISNAYEQEPKTGHWIDKNIRGNIEPFCSACGDSVDTIYHYDYCPNCGAMMIEQQEVRDEYGNNTKRNDDSSRLE